jgi:hypothetical protein
MSLVTLCRPNSQAIEKAFFMALDGDTLRWGSGLTTLLSNGFVTSTLCAAAKATSVRGSRPVASTSAPFRTSSFTTAPLLRCIAYSSGVLWSESLGLTLHLGWSSNSCAVTLFPCCAAHERGVRLLLSLELTSAFFFSRVSTAPLLLLPVAYESSVWPLLYVELTSALFCNRDATASPSTVALLFSRIFMTSLLLLPAAYESGVRPSLSLELTPALFFNSIFTASLLLLPIAYKSGV